MMAEALRAAGKTRRQPYPSMAVLASHYSQKASEGPEGQYFGMMVVPVAGRLVSEASALLIFGASIAIHRGTNRWRSFVQEVLGAVVQHQILPVPVILRV
jgi:hypothetical protein